MPAVDAHAPARRLVVNADDFGHSSSVNQAVVRAHREGILTTASLMVNEPGFEEAVDLARQHPALGVGLHLSLLMGQSTLPARQLGALVDEQGRFSSDPVRTGMRYFFRRGLRDALRAEIHAQFAKFRQTGLSLDHVNGHLHMHLHPVVFGILMEDSLSLGIRHLRWTRDPFWLNAGLASGRWGYRASHALIYRILSARARAPLRARGIRHTNTVVGLLQNGRVDTGYVTRLLPRLPAGDSELYSHPSLDDFRHEFDALINPQVKCLVEQLGIRLMRYQDL